MIKQKPELINKKECTGCGTCAQVCNQKAIQMTADAHGFLHPVIDADKCIGCQLCEKKCPIGKDDDGRNEKASKVVAAWHKDEQIRMTSSSGGAFTAIAEYVLGNGGVVWGAAFGEGLKLSYKCVDRIEDLDKLRRSKYLQSKVDDAYLQVKKQLQDGKMVLFVGTSCHVRGLYQVVGQKLRENLITADFICHGVPSPKVFADYVAWIEKRYGDKLVNFNFRDKRYGWDNGILTVGTFEKIGERNFFNDENSYFTGMLNNMFIRECCYQCSSNGLKRHSDFTIADFWGIGRVTPYEHEAEKIRGISMVAMNSAKALKLFEEDLQYQLEWTVRSLDEAVAGNGNYIQSSRKNPKSEEFWAIYKHITSWDDCIKLLRPTFPQKCRLIIKRYLGPVVANKLRKIIGR